MSARTPPGRSKAAGFTLLEIIVAFAVAALVLGALYQIFATGLRSGTLAERQSRALLLAESTLEAVGAQAAIAAGAAREEIDGGFERTTRVRPRPDLMPAGDEARRDAMIYEVEVSVSWRDGRTPRSVSLTILKAGSPAP